MGDLDLDFGEFCLVSQSCLSWFKFLAARAQRRDDSCSPSITHQKVLFHTNCVPNPQVPLESLFPRNISHLLQSEAEFWHSESQCPNAHCSPHKVINSTKKMRKQMDDQFISGHFLINSNFTVAPPLLNPPLPHSCGTANMLILLFRHPVIKNLPSGLRKNVRMKQHLV